MSRVAVFPQRVRVSLKRKKTRTKRTVTVANWRRICTRLQRLENANRKMKKRLQKAGI